MFDFTNTYPKEPLVSYNYQPELEKRFNQLKSVHKVVNVILRKGRSYHVSIFYSNPGHHLSESTYAMKQSAIKSLPIV